MSVLTEIKQLFPEEKSYPKLMKDLSMTPCPLCKQDTCDIWMRGYGYDMEKKETQDILLCRDCAMQLLRMLAEDICVFTKGGRHG